ncbi:MAG: ammonium transporter, partial [Candidatus Dormibacteria bacterium]
ATLVGLMSVPGLAILYAGIMKRKWAVNSAMMVLYAFAMTLIVWTLFAYNMSFGHPGIGTVVGQPGTVLSANSLEMQAQIPLLNGLMPPLRFPLSSMVYFQFVFAAITVIILGGSLLGRISFKAWALLVPLWITLVYSVGAFSIWGGGWLSQMGAVDFSGGYVIHVAAAVSGFTAAAVIGPRLLRDRQHTSPSNLIMAVAGGGLLWLGWAGFNGGDPYFANADAAGAILNTHLCTATALCTWVMWDALRFKKVSVAGAINGMVAGLVAITPAAGFIDGYAALVLGVLAGTVPWVTINLAPRFALFRRVDDTLGVIHTHGFAGALGGLFTGVMADPKMVEYLGVKGTANSSIAGLWYGNPHQLLVQFIALVFIIGYDAVATFIIVKLIGLVVPLRAPDAHLESGDQLIHGEVAVDLEPYPGAPHLPVPAAAAAT